MVRANGVRVNEEVYMADSKQLIMPKAGFIPESGYITGQELADRLNLKDVKNLQIELETVGMKHIKLGSKRVYRCTDLQRLFFDEG